MKNNERPMRWKTGKIFPLILVFLALTISCQKDSMFLDPGADIEYKSALNSTEIAPGKYAGDFDNCEWIISLPDPDAWNALDYRYMIFYAHGMVDPVPYEEIKLPDDRIGDRSVEDIVVGNNIGYASTSYRDNGLVVLDAVEDIKELVNIAGLFFDDHPEYMPPDMLILGGPSEGGLVTTKTIEKYPQLFQGAISIGGPIGDFWKQLQYMGDFHVLFNYFFGNELAAMGINIGNPQDGVETAIMDAWKWGNLQDIIAGIMVNNPDKVKQLIKCAGVTVDTGDEIAVGTAMLELLRFNIMLTNDIIDRMGGVPFDNMRKWYHGSYNDWRLNRYIQRVRADYTARVNVRDYETTADIEVPVVTIHTTGDHVVPFWHNPKYRYKAFIQGNSLLHTGIPVDNYGHCTIEESHIMAALYIVISKAMLIDYFSLSGNVFDSPGQIEKFKEILKDNAIEVEIRER